jgi:hypothetical protein
MRSSEIILAEEVTPSSVMRRDAIMATPALSSQVAAKWQEAFARLNHEQPGIVGLARSAICAEKTSLHCALTAKLQAWTLATEYLRPRGVRGAPARVYSGSLGLYSARSLLGLIFGHERGQPGNMQKRWKWLINAEDYQLY